MPDLFALSTHHEPAPDPSTRAMSEQPQEVSPPPHSRVLALLPGASFHDAWAIHAAEPGLCALDQFLRAARRTPRWVDRRMRLRNAVVRQIGLKDLGDLGAVTARPDATHYQPGDRVGIFTLFENHPEEALLGDRDRHLDVVLSVHCAPDPASTPPRTLVTLTTVVHVHNLLGRAYMWPVAPMHRIIAPAVLRAVGR
jgi:Protein of unknown function (DUF2867)